MLSFMTKLSSGYWDLFDPALVSLPPSFHAELVDPPPPVAWLRAQPTVGVPIASARTVEQLAELMQHIDLTEEQVALLD